MINLTVSKYRNIIENCFDDINQHWHSCVGEVERLGWFIRAIKSMRILDSAICLRAKKSDLTRKKDVLARFVSHSANNMPLWTAAIKIVQNLK